MQPHSFAHAYLALAVAILSFVVHVNCINREAHPDTARPSVPPTRSKHQGNELKRPTLRSVEQYACTGCLGCGSNQ
eukprot:762557-Rhodomonas_salina.1